ncbi:MAG: L-aspartate oxidase [Candidatus Marinimicrobia bacterium]|nr:L-aspartate oxidase [Candidatus Neomarinimicrobiota bacterium]MCF7829682.1 L-aspartate oxidase [Candidatus Neomarinimicrobiota bacterium]MCF7879842.1 L-aspartate oxidase [Candidatus Neomarinimicrobiota bacterium]
MTPVKHSDFLVIGSGIAGLSFALKAAEIGSVTIVTKKEHKESNTNYAQGGIAAVWDSTDSYEQHVQDTLTAGAGLCDEEAVRTMVKEGPDRVRELIDWGVRFSKDGANDYALSREGGHSQSRILYYKDITGWEIERALVEATQNHPNITLLENHMAVDLITEHHTRHIADVDDLHCFGAYVLKISTGEVIPYGASNTMLCSGGAARAYLHSTNPDIATGDGIAMGYRAGAILANLEFVQFHPTLFYNPGNSSFLISEAVRGYGGKLLTGSGDRFMPKYDERAELAPRDIVARAIDTEMKKSGDSYVLLDITHKDAEDLKSRFPNIYQHCLEYKYDLTKEPIPVVPAAHYVCGGIDVDLNARTNINGLYTIGEVACTGVHGANRLASNSLLEAVVFSDRAIRWIASNRDEWVTVPRGDIPEWDDRGTKNAEEWVLISHDRQELQELMWDYVGIIRSNVRLKRAFRRVLVINEEVEDFYRRTKVTSELLELRNLAAVSYLMIRSALEREESRGLHYTTDYPETKEAEKHDTVIQRHARPWQTAK